MSDPLYPPSSYSFPPSSSSSSSSFPPPPSSPFPPSSSSSSNEPSVKGSYIPQDEFSNKANQFKEKYPNTRVWILTPCFSSLCYVGYVSSLIKTIEYFRQAGIQLCIEFCRNDSLISRARNNMVARAMNDPQMSHVIFIDNDISWTPVDMLKLLIQDKDLIGGIYPLKKYHWEKLISDPANPYNSNPVKSMLLKKEQSILKGIMSDEEFVQNNLLRYNVNYLNETMVIENSVSEVKHIPTGFMCIKRTVFEQMMAAFPSTHYTDDVSYLKPEENKFAYALFDCGVEEGHYFSEDWLFSSRWKKLGGKVYADFGIKLTHTGIEDYSGFLLSTIV